MPSVYIIDLKRSPIGKTNGALAHCRPELLLAELITAMPILKKTAIDDVLIASAVGLGGNIARLSILAAGCSMATTATTIDFQCGGSLKTLEYGFYAIASGHKDLVVAGGVESTSQEPRVYLNPKDPHYHGEIPEKRGQFAPCSLGDPDMLEGAENCYNLLKPAPKAIEDIVITSHKRAAKATEEGVLTPYICPIKDLGGQDIYKDESIRPAMNRRLIQRAKPLVTTNGYTTAANSCLTHDGAALMVLASAKKVKALGVKPLAEIIGIESVGLNPNYSPLGPIAASKRLMKRYKLKPEDLGVVEVNEAFAVKTWALRKYLKLTADQVNPLGGALAYGHPYGATGGILMTHLIAGLENTSQPYGIATMGVAGGQGISVLIRRQDESLAK